MVKKSACNDGDLGLNPGSGKSPGGGGGNPLQYSCLENPHGQRSLAGYSPWSHKESDTTEQLTLWAFHVVKNLPANAGVMRRGFDPWVGKIPWRRVWQPTPIVLPGESHRQRSLEGYSLWGCKESDRPEATEPEALRPCVLGD